MQARRRCWVPLKRVAAVWRHVPLGCWGHPPSHADHLAPRSPAPPQPQSPSPTPRRGRARGRWPSKPPRRAARGWRWPTTPTPTASRRRSATSARVGAVRCGAWLAGWAATCGGGGAPWGSTRPAGMLQPLRCTCAALPAPRRRVARLHGQRDRRHAGRVGAAQLPSTAGGGGRRRGGRGRAEAGGAVLHGVLAHAAGHCGGGGRAVGRNADGWVRGVGCGDAGRATLGSPAKLQASRPAGAGQHQSLRLSTPVLPTCAPQCHPTPGFKWLGNRALELEAQGWAQGAAATALRRQTAPLPLRPGCPPPLLPAAPACDPLTPRPPALHRLHSAATPCCLRLRRRSAS